MIVQAVSLSASITCVQLTDIGVQIVWIKLLYHVGVCTLHVVLAPSPALCLINSECLNFYVTHFPRYYAAGVINLWPPRPSSTVFLCFTDALRE